MDVVLRHQGQTARVGFDPRRGGCYVEFKWNGAVVVFDGADLCADGDPIMGGVRVLASWGFVDPLALEELRTWLPRPSCWRRRRPSRRVQRILSIIEALEG